MKESKVTVKIPRPLYRKIQLVIESSGFNSPTDFIVFVLRDLVGEWDRSQKAGQGDEVFSADEIRAVKEKLRNLGYL
ncbi:MAG: CopG family transcriptional regulator [Planctomycetota bacterium]